MNRTRTASAAPAAALWSPDPNAGLVAFVRAVAGVAFGLPRRDPRLGAAGGDGWSIPPELAAAFAAQVRDNSALLRHALEAPVVDGHLRLPVVDDSDRPLASLHAGFNFRDLPDDASDREIQITTSTPKVGLVQPRLRRLAALWPMTSEVATDDVFAFGLGALARALAMHLDDEIAHAARISPAAVEVAAEAGQVAGSIVAENIAGMIGRIPGESFRRGCWVTAPATLSQLVELGATDATPPSGMIGWYSNPAEPGSGLLLVGRPVVVQDHAPAAGEAGDLFFIDPGLVATPRLEDHLSFAVSGHAAFLSDEVLLRLVVRWEAVTAMVAPILPSVGEDEISPYVRLAARPA